MATEKYSGEALAKALREGSLAQATVELIGMVKTSDKENHVAFSQQGCEQWVDIPTEMIEEAEQTGWVPCKDHGHPIMKIRLKTPSTPEGKILFALLGQQRPQAQALQMQPQERIPASMSRQDFSPWSDNYDPYLRDRMYEDIISALDEGFPATVHHPRPPHPRPRPPYHPPCKEDYVRDYIDCWFGAGEAYPNCVCMAEQRRQICEHKIPQQCPNFN